MKIEAELIENKHTIKNNTLLFLTGITTSILFVFAMHYGLSLGLSLMLLGLAVIAGFFFNFNIVYSIFVLVIFIPVTWIYHISLFYTLILIASFLICFPNIELKDFSNPLKSGIVIYLISVVPSLFNSIDRVLSIVYFYNFLGIIVVMLITMIALNSEKKMLNAIFVYLFGVFVNSVYVIYVVTSTGKRAWGFSGIFYVDFVGIATLVSFILFIYSSSYKKVIFALSMIISTIGLILTQTRNSWLSTLVAVAFLFFLLITNTKKFRVSLRSLLSAAFGILLIASIGYFGASKFSTSLDNRLSQKAMTTQLDDDPYSAGENSFVTRAFIWHTATMAFLEHPIIGIGTYSFPFSSQLYYKVPKSFFEIFVKNRDPHITYLAVLTETGIIGFVGFMFFIVGIIKLVRKNLKLLEEEEDVMITVLICSVFVYIIFSMAMTSSWIWGQQAMIMGIFLGFLVCNNQLLEKKQKLINALR